MLFLTYIFATAFAVILAQLLSLIKKLCRGQLRPGNAALKIGISALLLVLCVAGI